MRLLRAWAVHEARVWRALRMWLLRRRDGVGGDVRGFGYARAQASTWYGVLFVLVVETVGMSFFTAPYPALHWVMLAADLYTLLLLLGMHAACVVRPHTVGPEGLRIRQGARLDVTIPAHLIVSVRRELAFPHGKAEEGVLDVPVAAQTSLTVELAEPVPVVRLGGRREEVRTVRVHADDAAGAVAAIEGVRAAARTADAA
ncbi:hypothetical protein ACFP1Z_07265 [Streptomyces gamaensis]|uniref:Integral membrane protein n=1 Tax=Streptomyces gamaensis TaxID=1763542 RepID=A0ABW0YTU3_9ACTN